MKTPASEKPNEKVSLALCVIVWALRIGVGALFVMSGLVKAIDLWGTVFKFEEYLTAWAIDVPQSLVVLGAMGLCSLEFLTGAMLALGCFRRVAVWTLLAMMAVMLPLTLYIWIADPVSDCGCFGDFWVISNGATFFKNILITAALVLLVLWNRKTEGLYNPYSQWICGVALMVFVTAVELYGYNVQPLLDFRSFPVGTSLLPDENGLDDAGEDMVFVYEKDGVKKEFSVNSTLPDSTWTFIERKTLGANDSEKSSTELAVSDEEGDDITLDVISGSGLEMVVVVPQYSRADIFYTSFTNELNTMMNRMGGSLVELTDLDADSIETLRDWAMADFPIYRAESTVLKELSRGIVSVVLLRDGRILWKRNMGSIDVEALVKSHSPEVALEMLAPGGKSMLIHWSEFLLLVLVVILVIDKTASVVIKRRKDGKGENKSVNLQDANQSEKND